MTRADSFQAGAGPHRLALAAIFALLAAPCGCGPSRPPAWIAEVEALAAGKAMDGVMAKAPGEWKAAQVALLGSKKAMKSGDEGVARILATKASILFKTAVAVSRGIDAKARAEAAEDRLSSALADAEKLRSRRLDAEARFLSLKSFHESQGDLAAQKLAALEKDKEAVASMSASQKEKWMALEAIRCDREVQRCRATLLAAEALGCGEALPAESGDAGAALAKAGASPASQWESRRVLVDDAALRADRFLEHCRALHEPDPLANPAGESAVLEVFVKAFEGTGAMVSASARGIVIAMADPDDGQGGLSKKATAALGIAAGVLGKMAPATILVEDYPPLGCSGDGCAESAKDLAGLGASALGGGGESVLKVEPHGWGTVTPVDPGPCLGKACPKGRLDLVVLSVG